MRYEWYFTAYLIFLKELLSLQSQFTVSLPLLYLLEKSVQKTEILPCIFNHIKKPNPSEDSETAVCTVMQP